MIVCPLFRVDRESPLLLAKIWDTLGSFIPSPETRLQRSLWIALARRAFHNSPPAREKLMPALCDFVNMNSFETMHKASFIEEFSKTARAIAASLACEKKGKITACEMTGDAGDGKQGIVQDTMGDPDAHVTTLYIRTWLALVFAPRQCSPEGGKTPAKSSDTQLAAGYRKTSLLHSIA